MSAFGGKIVDTKGLFSVAELSRARTNRENICRSSGRDSADPVSLGSGGLSPQWLRITTETFCCVFVDLIKHGARGKLCCPACEGWDLVIYWSPLTSYSKARSCETYCSGSWQTHWLLSHRTSSLVFLLSLSKIPPSNTSVVPTRWHHTTWVSQEWHFLSHQWEEHEVPLKILPGVFSGRVFRRKNASKTLSQKLAHFPTRHCLLSPGTQQFMHVLRVSRPRSSPGRPGHRSLQYRLQETSLSDSNASLFMK